MVATALPAEVSLHCSRDKGRAQVRIIDGTAAGKEVSGWQVSIALRGHPACGGSLIRDDLVLTAAHCLYDPNTLHRFVESDYLVGHGSTKLSELKHVRVRKIFEHEDYDPRSSANGNDIAIFWIERPTTFRGADTPQVLSGVTTTPAAGVCSAVTGWGNTVAGDSNSGSEQLMMTTVPVVDRTVCERSLKEIGSQDGFTRLAVDQICAGYPEGGTDACHGDSGGPLIVRQGPFMRQAGIVSWGYGCAEAGAYGVYTDVSYHRRWIQSVMEQTRPGARP
jgi:secreted trypsin-like serine protease